MAGDSEQTLQNHQQPNGGEPFLIGVSGGTASGKVRVRAPCPPGGRRMWPAPAGRVSCSQPPRGPRDPRSGPPRSGPPDPAQARGAALGGPEGDRGERGSRVRVPPTSPHPQGWCAPSPVPGGGGGGGCDSWSGSCGGGAGSGCLLFCKSGVGTGLSGASLGAPGALLRPAWPWLAAQASPWADEGGRDARGGAPAARSPPGGLQGFPGEPKLDGRSHGWDDSRGCCCLLWLEKENRISLCEKVVLAPCSSVSGSLELLGSQGRGYGV